MKCILTILVVWAWAGAMPTYAASAPDLTRGGKPGDSHDWTLGPTGARGWFFTKNGHSHDAREILISKVHKASPADGALEKDDVILGLDGNNFAGDARVLFAKAITFAESERGQGKLRLLRWRDGKTATVELTLPILGAYSETAPYDCPKSRHILELGCESLAARMAKPDYARNLDPIPRSLNALALLASGNKNWLPLAKREAQWGADLTADSFATWYYGYAMTLVAEYVIATDDRSVMPGLQRLALESARGQSAVGTWGHRFAMPNGNLGGYGSMNQPGITLLIGMTLAREAGVREPELDRAIAKGKNFVRWYVNKGAVPYGDHEPFPAHEDNGKCSSAAVLYDLLADREASNFFGKMATAAYDERECGHTGDFFNILWALPGVARCGPLATGAYLREQGWYYDLARGWDMTWHYQVPPAGDDQDDTYKGWDCSGGYLLAYALPLKSLRITGKKPFCVPTLDAAQVAEVINAGRDFDFGNEEKSYDKRSTDRLLAGLSSWSPAVRKRSAEALGRRGNGDFLPTLLKLLASTSRDTRYGACEAMGNIGPRADAAAPQLRALLKDSDPWMQSLAAEALARLGNEARRASVSDLRAMTLRANPADPRRMAQRAAAVALFSPYPGHNQPRSILADSLDGVDRALLIPAVRSLLQNEDSVVRGSLRTTFNHLTDEDLIALLPDIANAIVPLAPSNEMFADGVRLAGLDLLSRLKIRQGMALCVAVMEPERFGEKERVKVCLNYLQRYGVHAKPLLPTLQDIRTRLAKLRRPSADYLAVFDKAMAAIESSREDPTLVDLAEFKGRSGAK